MKKSKYSNQKITAHGITWDSKKELRRYEQLLLLERAGEIKGLKLQPEYVLAPSVVIQGRKRPPLRYRGDFSYTDFLGNFVVEDTKGFLTDVYKTKRHLMKSLFNIEIKET